MISKSFSVAENHFTVCVKDSADWPVNPFELMSNYDPFVVEASAESVAFSLDIEVATPVPYVKETSQDEEDQQIFCGHTEDGLPVFDFFLHHVAVGMLVCSADYRNARLLVPPSTTKPHLNFAINNALMVHFALATACSNTLLFHSAVVEYEGRGYMFLGKSGTGKSTHARLWLKYNEGSELLNDDNPVVRFDEARGAVVYGSPWSGKTPCYKNREVPVGGIVLLSQAPYNKIERLSAIQAYAAVVISVSGKRWDKKLADGLHETENALAAHVPIWHLECLPDEEAAKVCREAVTGVARG